MICYRIIDVSFVYSLKTKYIHTYQNLYIMKNDLFLLSTICIISFFNSAYAQDYWINKNESENYVARHECSFVQSGNKFIMFGGREQAKRLDIYDYSSNTWSQGTEAPIEFNHFQATEYDGLVWIIGAFKTNNFPNEIPADHIYIYNPSLNIWMEGPMIPPKRRRGGAGLVTYKDKFYLVGGNTKGHNGGYIPWFDVYDPLNNNWKQLKDAPISRDHFSAAIIDDNIYAISGRKSGGPGGTFGPLISQVDVYDLKKGKWSTLNKKQNLPTPRAGASIIVFENELFVIGGEGTTRGPAFKKVEAYKPSTNSWSNKSDLNFPRHGTQAIVSGKGIYIAGGSPVQAGGRQHHMEVYKKDEPKGDTIRASTLSAVKEVIFNPNKTRDISITSSGGNAGNFITNIAIIGDGSSNFVIKKTLLNHLIKSKTTQEITMLANTSTVQKTANLIITYDDGKNLNIKLKLIPSN